MEKGFFIVFVASFLVYKVVQVQCKHIECDWARQYICGDQCIGNHNTCHCGWDTLPSNKTLDYYCCNQNPCIQQSNGDVECQGGQLQEWWQLCYGYCKQNSRYGYNMIPCEDKSECYKGIYSCRGNPLCQEYVKLAKVLAQLLIVLFPLAKVI